MLDHIAQNRHVLFAIFCNFVFLTRTPPFDRLQSITTLRGAKSVFCELIELDAMPEQLMKFFEHIPGSLAKGFHWSVCAQNFDVEAVAVEGDDVRELLQFLDEFERFFFVPAPETV